VTLVEISDFQCPFCRDFAMRTLPALDSAYIRTGKVRMLYINMPLPMHSHAWGAAEAALCAGAQDAFWPMHDRLFAGQDEWSRAPNPTERFVAYAGALQLDMAAFRRCVDEDQVAPILIGDLMQATQNRINSTPTFVLNETDVLTGALPFAEFQKRIEAALAAPRP
jgi:protein-disulfide isomerase